MRLVKFAMIYGIAVIFPAMVFYGTSILFEEPDRQSYSVPYPDNEYVRYEEDATEKARQKSRDDMAAYQSAQDDANNRREADYQAHSAKSFWIAIPLALIALGVGAFAKIPVIGPGMILGGLFTLMGAYGRHWAYLTDGLRFLSLLLGFGVIIYGAYSRFKDDEYAIIFEWQNSRWAKFAMILGIAVLFRPMIEYGIATIYPPPERTSNSIPAPEQNYGAEPTQEEADAYREKRNAYNIEVDAANKTYDEARKRRAPTVFYITTISALIALAVGGLWKIQVAGPGLMLGALFVLGESFPKYWRFMGEGARFLALLAAFVLLIYMAYRRFGPQLAAAASKADGPEPETAPESTTGNTDNKESQNDDIHPDA